jgi:hypothetical protein
MLNVQQYTELFAILTLHWKATLGHVANLEHTIYLENKCIDVCLMELNAQLTLILHSRSSAGHYAYQHKVGTSSADILYQLN